MRLPVITCHLHVSSCKAIRSARYINNIIRRHRQRETFYETTKFACYEIDTIFAQRDELHGACVFLTIPWAEPRFGHAGGFLLWCVIQMVPSGAHTGSDRERENYNISTRARRVSLLSDSSRHGTAYSKAETNFTDLMLVSPLKTLVIARSMRGLHPLAHLLAF